MEGQLLDNNISEVWRSQRSISGFKAPHSQTKADSRCMNDMNNHFLWFDLSPSTSSHQHSFSPSLSVPALDTLSCPPTSPLQLTPDKEGIEEDKASESNRPRSTSNCAQSRTPPASPVPGYVSNWVG